jgi:hypothetical protein
MSSSLVFKLSIALLLPLTLAWKLSVRPGDPAELAQNDKAAQLRIAEFLTRQHFSVAVADSVPEGQPSIRASAGACRLLVAKSPATGWDRDVLRRHATGDDRMFVVFRGKIYDQQPTFLTVSDYLWARFRRELGLGGAASPVLAIIATAICDAKELPWRELS